MDFGKQLSVPDFPCLISPDFLRANKWGQVSENSEKIHAPNNPS
jgi:hypothetical protein